jgi:hypothetical protein
MTATREYRNLGSIEDAVANVGMAITVFWHLYTALAAFLPDDTPGLGEDYQALLDAHAALQQRLGV